jgi:membrane protein DedA with SNARE-associated domain
MGASLLLFAKFVPLVAMIASPLAGAMGVGWPVYLLFSTLGSLVWSSAAIGAVWCSMPRSNMYSACLKKWDG